MGLYFLSVFPGRLQFLFLALFPAVSLEHTMLQRYSLYKWMKVNTPLLAWCYGGTKEVVGTQRRLLTHTGRSGKVSWRKWCCSKSLGRARQRGISIPHFWYLFVLGLDEASWLDVHPRGPSLCPYGASSSHSPLQFPFLPLWLGCRLTPASSDSTSGWRKLSQWGGRSWQIDGLVI